MQSTDRRDARLKLRTGSLAVQTAEFEDHKYLAGFAPGKTSLVCVKPEYDYTWENISMVMGFPVLPPAGTFTSKFNFNGFISTQQMLACIMNRSTPQWRVCVDMDATKYPPYTLLQLYLSVDEVMLDQAAAERLWGRPDSVDPLDYLENDGVMNVKNGRAGWEVFITNDSDVVRTIIVRDILRELGKRALADKTDDEYVAYARENIWPVADETALILGLPKRTSIKLVCTAPRSVCSAVGQRESFAIARCQRISPEEHPVHGGLNTFEYPNVRWPLELVWLNRGWEGRVLLTRAIEFAIRRFREIGSGMYKYTRGVNRHELCLQAEGFDSNYNLPALRDTWAFGATAVLVNYCMEAYPSISLATVNVEDAMVPILHLGLEVDHEEVLKVATESVVADLEGYLAAIGMGEEADEKADQAYLESAKAADKARMALLPGCIAAAKDALDIDLLEKGDPEEIERLGTFVAFDIEESADHRLLSHNSDLSRALDAIGPNQYCCNNITMTVQDFSQDLK